MTQILLYAIIIKHVEMLQNNSNDPTKRKTEQNPKFTYEHDIFYLPFYLPA